MNLQWNPDTTKSKGLGKCVRYNGSSLYRGCFLFSVFFFVVVVVVVVFFFLFFFLFICPFFFSFLFFFLAEKYRSLYRGLCYFVARCLRVPLKKSLCSF